MDPLVRFRARTASGRGASVRVAPGTSVLEAARLARMPLASACSGGALCARCGVEVLATRGALPAEGEAERRAKRANRVEPALRLACRLAVHDDIAVTTRYW